VIFEVRSALCQGAQNSTAFIIGRAIAGIGSAGIFSGSTVIIAHIVPLRKRPIYVGLMGSMFGISSVIGPLMGGAFTTM
jgi:MFS family permease